MLDAALDVGTRCPVLRSYQERLRSSVAVPSCTMRLPDRSSGSASPRFSRQRRIRAASSLPMMIRASEPPIKKRRLTSVRPIERDIFISSKRYLGYYHRELWLSIPQVSFDTREIELVNLSSELIRAARALLRWDQRQLADRSSVSLPTVKRLEAKPGSLAAHGSTVAALRRALEDAGVEFTNGDQPGVRLRKASPES